MNLRHAAALALMGWYLIIPPPVGMQEWGVTLDTRVNSKAPLSQWVQLGQYDNANECAAAQEATLRSLGRQMGDVRGQIANLPSSDKLLSERNLKLFEENAETYFKVLEIIKSQCISSDDPRLKP
jgi:hypothetical protein